MYYKDDSGLMDASCIRNEGGNSPNTGHIACHANKDLVRGTKASRKFDMIWNKGASGEKQRRLLSTLKTPGDAKIEITHASLFVCKAKVLPRCFLPTPKR